jgi:uncharacterized membrane protein YeiB
VAFVKYHLAPTRAWRAQRFLLDFGLLHAAFAFNDSVMSYALFAILWL